VSESGKLKAGIQAGQVISTLCFLFSAFPTGQAISSKLPPLVVGRWCGQTCRRFPNALAGKLSILFQLNAGAQIVTNQRAN